MTDHWHLESSFADSNMQLGLRATNLSSVLLQPHLNEDSIWYGAVLKSKGSGGIQIHPADCPTDHLWNLVKTTAPFCVTDFSCIYTGGTVRVEIECTNSTNGYLEDWYIIIFKCP